MTVRYLLDTNICIYISKKRPLEVYQKLSELREPLIIRF
jgi:predicted nucleic acid-binding protein